MIAEFLGETASVDSNCGLDYGPAVPNYDDMDAATAAIMRNNADPNPVDQKPCGDALNSKCKASKAFAIIGVISNVVAFLPLFVEPMRDSVGVAATGVASFSYLIIFAIAASYYNGDPVAIEPGASCGSGCEDS